MTTDRRQFLRSSLTLAALSAAGSAQAAQSAPRRMRRIAVEETFTTREFQLARTRLTNPNATEPQGASRPGATSKLHDLGSERLADMDAAGIDVQVISIFTGTGTIPATISTGIMQRANDALAEAVRAHPKRFAGLIGLFPQNVADAVREIHRGDSQLKLHGAIINSTTLNEYLDDPKYLPIFEALAEHDLSLYLHPARPPRQMIEAVDIPGFNTAWGFGVDAGTHAVRIMATGIFDRLPTLRLVLGHMGESLPFWAGRMDLHYRREFSAGNPPKMKELPSHYLRKNIFVTTSGMNFWPQLRMTMEVIGSSQVLFATDYPFENLPEAVAAIDAGPMAEDDRARLYHLNAERIFRIPSA